MSTTNGLDAYVRWLADRGHTFTSYEELWQWSIDDLEGFWASVWDYFEVKGSYERVLGSRDMPGAEWFPGARLNYAEHALGTDEDADRVAVVARSQTRAPIELTFGELREQVALARARRRSPRPIPRSPRGRRSTSATARRSRRDRARAHRAASSGSARSRSSRARPRAGSRARHRSRAACSHAG